jgi:transcriptional regulator with XRE-family HTH domain
LDVAKSQFHIAYRKVPALLVELRESAGLTQRALAARIGRTQSWVYKTESSMRRIDIAEFLDWCIGCDVDPVDAFRRLIKLK